MVPPISMRSGLPRAAGGGVWLVPGLTVRAGHTVAGKYRVEELLRSDASGVTLAARDVHLREPVLLRILASYTEGQAEQLERRLKKARIATGLKSPHVARIVDIGTTEDGMPFFAYEALDGNTLEEELAERGPLPVADATRWVLEACEGIAEAHTLGLVHGDIKPKNIVLAEPKAAARKKSPPSVRVPEADARVLKILDFAGASPLEAISDQTNAAFCSSPAYLAPEQIQDPESADARADVWAMGVLLYELLSGTLPFSADTVAGMIVAVVYDTPVLLTDAPYALTKIVARCLEKDPSKRPQDLYELAALLAAFAGANGILLSERVAVALEPPPPRPALRTAAVAPAPIEPLSVAMRASGIPLRKPRAARRRWQRACALAFAATALGAVGFGLGRLAMAQQGSRGADQPGLAAAISTTTVTSDSVVGAAAAEPAKSALPGSLRGTSAPAPSSAKADGQIVVPVVSFAPGRDPPGIPTPLATAATREDVLAPLVAATAPAPAAPLPAPSAARMAPRARVPAGLPATHQTSPPPSAARPAAPAPRPSPSDASYLRGFLSDR